MMRRTSTSSIYHGPSLSQGTYQVRELRSLAVSLIGTHCGAYSRYEAVYYRTFLEEAILYWLRWALGRDVIQICFVQSMSGLIELSSRSVMSPGEIYIPDRYAQNRSKRSMEYCATSCLSYQHGQLSKQMRGHAPLNKASR